MQEYNAKIAQFVAENPRMMGALFTLVLLLTQVGAAAAGATGGTDIGP